MEAQVQCELSEDQVLSEEAVRLGKVSCLFKWNRNQACLFVQPWRGKWAICFDLLKCDK